MEHIKLNNNSSVAKANNTFWDFDQVQTKSEALSKALSKFSKQQLIKRKIADTLLKKVALNLQRKTEQKEEKQKELQTKESYAKMEKHLSALNQQKSKHLKGKSVTLQRNKEAISPLKKSINFAQTVNEIIMP